MKILFLTGLYPSEQIEKFRSLSSDQLQMAADIFQWSIIDGLRRNDASFEVASFPFLPAFPFGFKSPSTPSCELTCDGTRIGDAYCYCTLPFFKSLSITRKVYSVIKEWILKNGSDKLSILSYTPYIPFLKAVKKIKKSYPSVKYSVIITDLIDDQGVFVSRFSTYKKMQAKWEYKSFHQLAECIDKYVLLTRPMEERIPESVGKNIIVEGLAAGQDLGCETSSKESKTIMYAGTFQPYSGLKEFIEAFKMTTSPDYRLKLCGHGVLTDYVKNQSEMDSRIIYIGMVSHDEVLRLQTQASVLINPRKPDNGITRFSFPSKTIEYMKSGTPMIGYRLEGIPEDYYRHMFVPESESPYSMTKLIDSVMNLSQEELDRKAADAMTFIKNNKSSEEQVGKILKFLEE